MCIRDSPQRHAAALAPVGDPVGGHLQRPGHHRADPAGPARGAIHPVLGEPDAAPQPLRLRPGGTDRPVRRDQAHRPDRRVPARDPVTMARFTATARQYTAAVRILVLFTVVLGVAYPLAVTAVAQAVSYTHLRAHETPQHLVC